jgi:ribonucleoside-diphosphate reductase alpha subunit
MDQTQDMSYNSESNILYVIKRNGNKEEVSFDKILNRIKNLCNGKETYYKKLNIHTAKLTMNIIGQLKNNIKTCEIDELTAEQCASQITEHPDYGNLAARIMISNNHKNTDENFSDVMDKLYNFQDLNGTHTPLISKELFDISQKYKYIIDNVIKYEHDYLFDYFGFKTLEKAYLMKINKKIVERPQHLIMRVAIGIHSDNIDSVLESYNLMSRKYFTHATPTLFNAGTNNPQMSSCYLIANKDDSIEGIYETLTECAKISKWAGGIGCHIHNVRGKGSLIRSSNGSSQGIVPMLKNFNSTARYVNQGGRRNGSFAMYLEPWHTDIEDFLQMRRNQGDEEQKARDLFYALWIPDLFMKRVSENSTWTLMCPDICKGLSNCYGEEFEELYLKYEKNGMGNKTINARDLWFKILDSQIETGNPYMLYKDACNKKSNQKNLGIIKSSNLCCEIVEYSDKDESAVCNLASIGLPRFVEDSPNIDLLQSSNIIVYGKSKCIYCKLATALLKKYNINFTYVNLDDKEKCNEIYEKYNINSVPLILINDDMYDYTKLSEYLTPKFNYNKLHEITKVITRNLNKIIDINFYPTDTTRRSNFRHRPIGIGVQGLADVFVLMNTSFDSDIAKDINKKIFETIYFASLETSCELSKERFDKMLYLKEKFNENIIKYHSDKPHSRDYYIVNETNISDDNIKIVQNYLNDIMPTYEEISRNNNIKPTQNGSYGSFENSPIFNNILQFDMWDNHNFNEKDSNLDWSKLRLDINKYGIRNSLLVAPMPTASTSQILGNNECFEPFTSNIYTRRTLAGMFVVINKHLIKDLISIGMWNNDIKNNIILHKGSVQYIEGLPQIMKKKYKIVWEIPMRSLIDMASDRAIFICQSQSMNLWMANPDYKKLTAMHFHSWKKGLKTGIYYLRTKAKAFAQQFTIDPSTMKKTTTDEEDEICEMCSG